MSMRILRPCLGKLKRKRKRRLSMTTMQVLHGILAVECLLMLVVHVYLASH